VSNLTIRVGVPLVGGRLVQAARDRAYPVLFSANAFAKTYAAGQERAQEFKGFRLPDPEQYYGLDAALDSAGFVAAARYGDYRWSVEDYYDLVAAHSWSWHASMDYCCEPQVARDRPLRILRIAATAAMLARCRAEAGRRALPMPMPVVQGWTAAEYVMCVNLLPLTEWPVLIGIGSVCRRQVQGPDGILSIIEALDPLLPKHVGFHLFGVKSTALELLANHPRVASADSMAWDFRARAERRTGRDIAFRVSHMQAWVQRQSAIAANCAPYAGVQGMLFDPLEFDGFDSLDALALEALALQYADLILDREMDYREAVSGAVQDGPTVLALLRSEGLNDNTLAECDDIMTGLGGRIENLAGAGEPDKIAA
jgi:hypothetical protein